MRGKENDDGHGNQPDQMQEKGQKNATDYLQTQEPRSRARPGEKRSRDSL
jgi:hypothetical protein